MNIGDKIPPSPVPPSETPSKLTIVEMAALKPADRNIHLYERHIEDLKEERARMLHEHNKNQEMLMSEKAVLMQDLKETRKYKIAHGKLHTARAENAFSSTVALLINGGGAAVMGIYPRTETLVPWQFSCGAAAVVIGILLGVVGKFFAVGIRRKMPWLIDDCISDD